MNTKIFYLYRDASNFKVLNACVIRGPITNDEIERILESCNRGEAFIPRVVGMPEKRFSSISQDDQPWFEFLDESSFTETAEEPTLDITAAELAAQFQKAHDNNEWDIADQEFDILVAKGIISGSGDASNESWNAKWRKKCANRYPHDLINGQTPFDRRRELFESPYGPDDYVVSVAVTGRVYVPVKKGRADEMVSAANEAVSEMYFGQLEDIDWDTVHIETPDGNFIDPNVIPST